MRRCEEALGLTGNDTYTIRRARYLMVAVPVGIFYILFYLSVPNEVLRDRANYIVYAASGLGNLDRYSGISDYFNEPLFSALNELLNNYFSVQLIPHLFVAFNVVVLVYFLIKKSKDILFFLLAMLLCVVFSYIAQYQLVVLRQGIGISLSLLAFFCFKSRKKVFLALCVCAFIHSIYLVIALYYFLNFIIFGNQSFRFKLLINFVASIILGVSGLFIASHLGLRQVERIENITADVGGGAFLVMMYLLVTIYIQKNRFNQDLLTFVVMGIVLFLVSYILFPYISGRLFDSFAPFLVILLISYRSYINLFSLIFLIAVYTVLYMNGGYNQLLLYPSSDCFVIFSYLF